MARPLLLAALVAFAASSYAQYSGVTPPPAEFKPGWDTINPIDAKTWLTYLAGPETQGRGTGQIGFQKAADFMAARFKEFGIKPAGKNGSYFQGVPFQRAIAKAGTSFFQVGGTKIEAGKGLAFTRPTGSGEAEGDVVFVSVKGDGELADPTVLKDKFVVLIDGAAVRAKLRGQIFDQDARLVRIVDKIENTSENVRRKSDNPPPAGPGRTLSTAIIARDRLAGLAKACGIDLTKLKVDGETGAVAAAGTGKAKLVADVVWEDYDVPNVVGIIEGSDPNLRAEYVGLGAHLDHLGVSNGVVYPGADDDGSGSTSLLLAARALAKSPVKPKRSIILMAFCGEEMGLIGSGYYVNNPLFPLDKMSCELQMDMVGRNEESQNEKASDNIDTIHLVGSQRISKELHDAVLAANSHVGFKFEYDEEDVYTRSDHYQFASKGIPIAFLFDGFHPDYHQPTDTVEKINFDKIANAARLFYLVAMDAATRPAMMKREVSKTGG